MLVISDAGDTLLNGLSAKRLQHLNVISGDEDPLFTVLSAKSSLCINNGNAWMFQLQKGDHVLGPHDNY